MLDIEKIKLDIVEKLKPLNPYQIILFGSYAYGTPTKDSDIDLYIVTKDDFIPQSFKENAQIFLDYSNQIRSLQNIIPIDIITHTKKMHEKFIALNSSFSREIVQKGIRLI